jgi:DNA replication licensing factor MCM6
LADINLARFIVDLHSKKSVTNAFSMYDYTAIKKYIAVAKKIKPRITKDAAELLKKHYIELRMKDKAQNQNNSYRITVRQL